MAVVRARMNLYAANGKLLVAKKDREGIAVRKMTTRTANFNKVAVRWNGRRKLYWHHFDDLEFTSSQLDPTAYIAVPPGRLLDLPSLPQPPTHYDYHFGDNLRRFREERSVPQWKLAKLMKEIGISVAQTTISYWERNDTAPNGAYVRGLSQVLNIPVFMFFINFRDCEWLRRVRRYVNQLSESLCEEGTV
jgi:transcriptional regulator with XRE-family HTH domain